MLRSVRCRSRDSSLLYTFSTCGFRRVQWTRTLELTKKYPLIFVDVPLINSISFGRSGSYCRQVVEDGATANGPISTFDLRQEVDDPEFRVLSLSLSPGVNFRIKHKIVLGKTTWFHEEFNRKMRQKEIGMRPGGKTFRLPVAQNYPVKLFNYYWVIESRRFDDVKKNSLVLGSTFSPFCRDDITKEWVVPSVRGYPVPGTSPVL